MSTKKTAEQTATVSKSATGTQAKGNVVTINTENIKVFAGYVIDYKYGKTDIGGNKVSVKYWDYSGKAICRITNLDSAAYLVEYIYTDKQGVDQKTRKVIIPGKDGCTMKTYEKDGFKNYTIETTYINNAGAITPNKRFSWSTKIK